MRKALFVSVFLAGIILSSCTNTDKTTPAVSTRETTKTESVQSGSTQTQSVQSDQISEEKTAYSSGITSTGNIDSTGGISANSGSDSTVESIKPKTPPKPSDASYFAQWKFQKFMPINKESENKENPEGLYYYSGSARLQGEFTIYGGSTCFRPSKATSLDLTSPVSVDEQKLFTKEELNAGSHWFCFKGIEDPKEIIGEKLAKKVRDITAEPAHQRDLCIIGTATIEISDYIRSLAGTEMSIDSTNLDKVIDKNMYLEPKCEQ